MRPLAVLLLVPALAWADPAADAAPAPAETGSAAQAVEPEEPALPRFGLLVDAGFPDGAVVSGVLRVADPIRLSLGLGYNGAGYGVRGTVGWIPFRWALSPVLSAEYGYYWEADLTWLAEGNSGVPPEMAPLLKDVGYSYASAMLGLEIGSQRGFSFSVSAGLTYVFTTVHGVSEAVNSSGGSPIVVEVQDPSLRATAPSVKAGFLLYF